MYENKLSFIVIITVAIIIVNLFSPDGWATVIPKTSFLIDDSVSKPQNLMLSLQWTNQTNTNTRTVYFKKFAFKVDLRTNQPDPYLSFFYIHCFNIAVI